MSIRNNRAWLFVVPALLVMAINAFIPFITVINYSVQDILPGLPPIYLGLEIRARRRNRRPVGLVAVFLVGFAALSLAAQAPTESIRARARGVFMQGSLGK